MERRAFLRKAVFSFFSLSGISLGVAAAFLYPARPGARKEQDVYLMDEDDLPRRGVRMVTFSVHSDEHDVTMVNRVFVVGSPEGVIALSPVCTHLGCFVNWDANRKEFICPCHGAKYTMRGEIISGPQPRPLMQLPLKVDHGKVYLGVKV
ncbi:MAG: ubiquinol-cytochrome c reductase iron-sulfur subunit [Nitrospiraceae bacterium]|jgi:cytochrome b6-f complex iron-sulfur subunit|nr:ubiquinol-cytochrome c reductase iron-sulfur subunit [Nitrospiraceae bacterium]